MSNLVYRRKAELLEAVIGEELVALEPAGGMCFGFNEVAAWVWRHLADPTSFDHLSEGLLAEFDVSNEQCRRELRELLDTLVAKNLVSCESD